MDEPDRGGSAVPLLSFEQIPDDSFLVGHEVRYGVTPAKTRAFMKGTG